MYAQNRYLLTIIFCSWRILGLLVFTWLIGTITLVWWFIGVGMQNLTDSREVVDILNTFEHSVSYHAAEGIPEKEMALSDIYF